MKSWKGLLSFTLVVSFLCPGVLSAQEIRSEPSVEPAPPSGTSKASSVQVSGDQLDTAWNHNQGDIVTRFGVDFTAVAGLEEGDVSVSDYLIIGISGGLGYFPSSRLSTDLDLSVSLSFAEEETELTRLTLTPGSRFYPIDQLYVRLGIPFVMTEPASVNGLVGAGYEIPVGQSTSLVGEVDIVYPFTEDGTGTITVGGGTSYTF